MNLKLIIIPLFAFALQCNAQMGIKGFLFSPNGELGQVMKKHISVEILKIEEFDGNSRWRFGFDYMPLKPRLDTFPAYAIKSDNGTIILPGYIVYKNCWSAAGFIGMDFRLMDNDKFRPYAGADFIFGIISYKYWKKINQSTDGEVDDSELYYGLRLRIGCEYSITDRMQAFLDLSAAGYRTEYARFMSHYEIGLGLSYKFRN